MEIGLEIIVLDGGKKPQYQTEGSSGMDMHARLPEGRIVLKPNSRLIIPLGVRMNIPKGYEIQLRSRSGLSIKQGLVLANGIGTIDSDFQGEIGAIVHNISDTVQEIMDGDRIAQAVLCRYNRADLHVVEKFDDETDRGSGGFGSTGKQ